MSEVEGSTLLLSQVTRLKVLPNSLSLSETDMDDRSDKRLLSIQHRFDCVEGFERETSS